MANKKETSTKTKKSSNISKYKQVIFTMIMLVLGVICGILMKNFLSDDLSNNINSLVFSNASSLFLNAIKMVIVPLVFCSIMQSVSGFTDLKQFGKIGVTIFLWFVGLSILAIAIGYVSYHLCPIGDTDLADVVNSGNISSKATKTANSANIEDYSLLNIVLNLIPVNIFQAFADANMMQIIFVAILFGVASMLLKEYSAKITKGLDIIYNLFLKVTNMIVKLMPIVIFCSMASICITVDVTSLVTVTQWVGLIYVTDIFMLIVYCVLLIIFARLNPFVFLQRLFPAMLTGFSLCSSSAAMPVSMNICDKELGLHKTIYSLGIPLGTTINMNGSCITQTITVFFMAQIFGVDITSSMFLSVAFTILVLAVGAPGIPGGALVCISVLLPTVGMPAEGIAIIIGMYPLVSMMQTMTNLTGDAVVTTIAARIFKMIDMSKWRKQKSKAVA